MTNAAPQNPMEFWQQTMKHWMPSSTICNPAKSRATAEPFAYNPFMQNPQQMMQLWQQSVQMWMTMMMPQQQQAQQNPMMDMMMQWQKMWMGK